VIDVRKTNQFTRWLDGLRDVRARAKVPVRLERMSVGNFGDVQPVSSGVTELRIHYGPGYRVYFVQQDVDTVVLLTGGTKMTQSNDIKRAVAMAKLLR
jgi:putative addiction module killer protein